MSKKSQAKAITGMIISGIIIVIIISIVLGGIYNVGEGEVGVMFKKFGPQKGYDPNELDQGYGFKMPFRDSVTTMSFRTQQIGFYGGDEQKGTYSAIKTKDSNGIFFSVDLTVRYRVDPTQASEFIEQKGAGIQAMDTILATAARADSTRGVFGKYAQEDVPENLIEIAQEIQRVLQQRIDGEASGKLRPGFMIIEAVDIRKVTFDPRIEEAIVNKQTQKQVAERKEYELQQAVKDKEIVLVNANRDKEAQVLRAEGEKEATILIATGKAEGIRLVNDAYQDMPESYVLVKFSEAIKPTDKVYFGFDSLAGGNTLPILDINQAAGLYSQNKIAQTTEE